MTEINARLIALTQPVIALQEATPEGVVAHCARVSDPQHQDEPLDSLLSYCIKNKDWSIFEMVNAVVEVEAPRDITQRLLQHRSFSFQEFSQRYSDELQFMMRTAREQDRTNRQNSRDDLLAVGKENTIANFAEAISRTTYIYQSLREGGVTKECARTVLPEELTVSRLYVNGTLRSWLNYLDVRDDPGVTQHEHVVLARAIKAVLEPAFPQVFKGVAK